MNKLFYIYHVPGVKIGCSTRPKIRVEEQGFTNFDILETHDDISLASQREVDLQVQYGYGRDNNCSYEQSYKARLEAGKKGGKSNKESGWITKLGNSQGRKNVESEWFNDPEGKFRKASSAAAKINGLKIPKEKLRAMGKIGGNKKVICPHCNKEGLARPMHRWHFNNCKLNGNKI
jgi:hypothetical protein